MSGTAKVSTEKDGIFGRILYAYDNSVFRRLICSTNGYLSVNNRPDVGYIPDQIDTIVGANYFSALRAIAGYLDLIYTVPANKILRFTGCNLYVNAGTITNMSVELVQSTGTLNINFNAAPVNATFYTTLGDLFIDSAGTINCRYQVTVNNSQIVCRFNGYLINKL
jgi:hypothetical protein